MTSEEAQKIARIIGTADGGCSVCVGDLVEKMNEAFPEFEWVAGQRAATEDECFGRTEVTIKPRS